MTEKVCRKCGSKSFRKKRYKPQMSMAKHGNPLKHFTKEEMNIVFKRNYERVFVCNKCGGKQKFSMKAVEK